MYTLPNYYVCQVLAQMAAFNCERSIFISYSAESTTVMIVTFDQELWNMIVDECKSVYGTETLTALSRLSENAKELKVKILKYAKSNV